ncbi:MAG TPA: helix-turn-helix domain-containing protein [Terriglobales bacterium]|nr:helix-turn-helix domain-containing protein [Terriglobales bacterium]
MPPIADKHLEERILKAALRLWRARGESGLTLRAVAKEARTTTPTLYKRFRSKEALRLALAYRFREELTADVLSSATIEQSHRRYLAYVKAHPREYELLSGYWGHFFSTPRPVRTWMLAQLAARLGGEPEQYSAVYEGIFLLCHGASTLLASAPDERVLDATRDICVRVCDKLIENASMHRAKA